MDDFNQQLSLVVLNSEQLAGSQQVQYRFDEMGGTLGASEQDDWQLKDRLGACCPLTPGSSSTTDAFVCAI